MTPQFHPLRINRLERFGDFAVAIGFEVPDGLAEAYRYLPGQYLTLRAEIDGAEVRRPYSICTPPHGGALGVGIKHVEGGLFSGFAVGELEIGDVIDVMTPQGRFTYADSRNAEDGPDADDAGRDILLLAAGSGVTPILSIAETVLATGRAGDRVTLVYGNRSSASIMFRDHVEYLKDRYLERCRVLHVLSREPRDADILNGRIDGDKVAALIEGGLVEPDRLDAAYLCGPDAMMTSCRAALEAAGVAAGRIATEHFTPAARPAGAPTRRPVAPKTEIEERRGRAASGRRRDAEFHHGPGAADGAVGGPGGRAGIALFLRGRHVLHLPVPACRGRGRDGRELFAGAVGDGSRVHPVLPGAPDDGLCHGRFRLGLSAPPERFSGRRGTVKPLRDGKPGQDRRQRG